MCIRDRDISHPHFEDHLNVVSQTLSEIGAGDKPVILVFNKIDAYREPPKDEHLLDPTKKQVLTLKELEKSWMSKLQKQCIFISATDKENIDAFRTLIFEEVKAIHTKRYPYDKLEYWGGV